MINPHDLAAGLMLRHYFFAFFAFSFLPLSYGESIDDDYLWALEMLDECESRRELLFCKAAKNGLLGRSEVGSKKEMYRAVKVAAELGDSQSQAQLADLYDNGSGAPYDKRKAVIWYKKSADQGNVYAKYNLAFHYLNGEGVKKDSNEAISLFVEVISDKGSNSVWNQSSIRALVDIYFYGNGVPVNIWEGAMWWILLEESKDNRAVVGKFAFVMSQYSDDLDKQDKDLLWDLLVSSVPNSDNATVVINAVSLGIDDYAFSDYGPSSKHEEFNAKNHPYFEESFTDAIDVITDLAGGGNYLAKNTLLRMYSVGGVFIDKDEARAAEWRKRSGIDN